MRLLLWLFILLLVHVPFPYVEKRKPASDSTVPAMESVEFVEVEEGLDYLIYTYVDGFLMNVTRIPKAFRNLPTYSPRQFHVHPSGFTLCDSPKELRSMSYEDDFFVKELFTMLALIFNTLLFTSMIFCLIRIIFQTSTTMAGVVAFLLCLIYLVFYVFGKFA